MNFVILLIYYIVTNWLVFVRKGTIYLANVPKNVATCHRSFSPHEG